MTGADPRAGPLRASRGQAILARLDAYERLVRLDKPIGILLLLWPTLAALWIAARGEPTWTQVLVFTMGTVLMRSAGCAINDWADRAFDPHVQRTAQRPLASGEVTAAEAVLVAAVLAFCAFLMVLATNRTTILLSLPAVVIAGIYPFFKRFFALPQAFLGIAFSFGIPMAFAAVFDEVPAIAWWMLAANLLWVVAYDTEYAMVDRDDDLRLGLRTSAIAFGRFDVAAVMLCYAVYLGAMVGVGQARHLGALYYAGLVAAAGCALWHGWLIRGRDRMRCFAAFLHNHWLGFAVFAGVAADFAWRLGAWPRGW
ncbi:MAG: 4-hydroxybenzoate octaprenyltransferase [Betaproteobacteria bacterium]|nr:4-hydroxybenzoate octaprenyltransferase [Betaproteobacteria bacterium]